MRGWWVGGLSLKDQSQTKPHPLFADSLFSQLMHLHSDRNTGRFLGSKGHGNYDHYDHLSDIQTESRLLPALLGTFMDVCKVCATRYTLC
jgi:hypothetical protein